MKAIGIRLLGLGPINYSFRISLDDAFRTFGGAGFSNQVQHVRLWKKASAGVL